MTNNTIELYLLPTTYEPKTLYSDSTIVFLDGFIAAITMIREKYGNVRILLGTDSEWSGDEFDAISIEKEPISGKVQISLVDLGTNNAVRDPDGYNKLLRELAVPVIDLRTTTTEKDDKHV